MGKEGRRGMQNDSNIRHFGPKLTSSSGQLTYSRMRKSNAGWYRGEIIMDIPNFSAASADLADVVVR